jgi:DNA-binding XRE family transcriptional regulator
MIHPVHRSLLHPFVQFPEPSPMIHPPAPEKPGARLRKARRQLGYTQQMLADFAQVGLSTIEKAERGGGLRMDSVHQLCQFFSERYQRTVTAEELGLL